jgi:hypothetical protein
MPPLISLLPPALPTDPQLEQKLGIPIVKIQAALLELERAGAIARASVFVRNKAQRRIQPSLEMPGATFPTAGNTDLPLPRGGSKHNTHGGDTEIFNKKDRFPALQLSTTQQSARKEARGAA